MTNRCTSTLTITGDNGAEAIIRCADVEGHLRSHSAKPEAVIDLPSYRPATPADITQVVDLSWWTP